MEVRINREWTSFIKDGIVRIYKGRTLMDTIYTGDDVGVAIPKLKEWLRREGVRHIPCEIQ